MDIKISHPIGPGLQHKILTRQAQQSLRVWSPGQTTHILIILGLRRQHGELSSPAGRFLSSLQSCVSGI